MGAVPEMWVRFTPAQKRKQLTDRTDFFVKPSAVAELALALVCQERSGWSFEAKARPFGEKW